MTSSCATWIQYSCGSFTNTQISPAVTTHQRRAYAAGAQRVRIAS